jgi:hypothetical protein
MQPGAKESARSGELFGQQQGLNPELFAAGKQPETTTQTKT